MKRVVPVESVELQFMRPAALQKVISEFPVVYVPFGLIEWHGKHLPLGTDALKAHGVLVHTARQFGGAVFPPVYFHEGFLSAPRWDQLDTPFTHLFERLKKTGFRVILGVSGHNTEGQIRLIDKALAPVIADGTVAGKGLWEVTLSQGPESGTDHAAKWETSDMMALYPELVDMAALGTAPLTPADGGMYNWPDPRGIASADIGERNIELASQAIGRKARELLASLPPRAQQAAPRVSPPDWEAV
jgi:creatinine amidohydrolase